MKKAKLFALLVCFGLSLSTFATACDFFSSESESESVASEQSIGSSEQPESESKSEVVSESESEFVPESESESEVESESETESESESESESEEEPTIYSVEFRVDGEFFDACYYTEEEMSIIAPEVPAKAGYTARWEAYELNLTNIVVNAVYEAIPYTITFNVDGVEPITFTVENMKDVVFPKAPQEDGWVAAWSITEADLTLADVTVELVKERLYTINFVGVDGFDAVVLPESQLANAVIPNAPAKDGYVTGWSEPVIDAENATITITYWEMTEKEYYTRDIKGAEMAQAIKPVWEGNQVVWDETEQAYHLINNNGVDDQRGFVFDSEYFAKMVEYGLYSISFEVKLDAEKAGEVIYKGFYPNWWGTMGVDMWQIYGAQDWVTFTYNVTDIPTIEGKMKEIFLLADQGSGMWIRNIDVWAPDVENLTLEDMAKSLVPHVAAQSSVAVDGTEGALVFNVDRQGVAEQTDKRGFIMNKKIYDALCTQGTHIEFKVKFIDAPESGKDGTFYISTVTGMDQNMNYDWWGYQLGKGYTADTWVDVSFKLNKDGNRTLFMLAAAGNFMIKDIKIAKYHEVMQLPANLSDLTEEHIASAFVPKDQSKNSVAWDATEGAWLFTNTVTSQDNNRAFLLDQTYYEALKAMGTGTITFKVKRVDAHVDGVDNSFYVSYATNSGDWGDWWGPHQSVGYSSDWITITTNLSTQSGKSLFLLCATGSFYLKDICFVTPSQLTSVYEFGLNPADVKVSGLNPATTGQWSEVNDAPAGVNGTALKTTHTPIYAGYAISFDAYEGQLSEDFSLSFRVYAESSAATMSLWFYNPDDTNHGGEATHVTKDIATNQWVDVTLTLSEVMVLLNSDGGFTGFQFGLFASGVSALYVDSLSIVTVVDPADIPLFNKNVSNDNER